MTYEETLDAWCRENDALRAEVERLRAEVAAGYSRGSPPGEWLKTEVWLRETAGMRARAEAVTAVARGLVEALEEWRKPKPLHATVDESLRWEWDRQARTDAALARAGEILGDK